MAAGVEDEEGCAQRAGQGKLLLPPYAVEPDCEGGSGGFCKERSLAVTLEGVV